jgi:hypothetical protein
MRLGRLIAASALATSVGLATGLAVAPAGADPAAPVGPTELCLSPPCEEDLGLATPTENPDDGGENPTGGVDVPIPADATFTG